MKHLKKFNEAVIMPEKLSGNFNIDSFESLVKYGEKNGFDVVEYREFYDSLPESDKKTAPPEFGCPPFFALFHSIRKKPMFVVVNKFLIGRFHNFQEILNDIINHEKIHAEQVLRKGNSTYSLPSPTDMEKYFSNKDEIMAFSWTIANGLSKLYRNLKSAINHLDVDDRSFAEYKMIWRDIKKHCDESVIKRYRKYIYMYLEKIFGE